MAAPLEESSFAPPGRSEAPTGPPAGPPPGLADRDGDGLSDALQAKLAEEAPGEFFDVVVTFSGPGNAASAQAAVGRFQVFRQFSLIRGFAATMTAAQAEALAGAPGVFRVEEDFEVTVTLDGANSDFGAEPARLDYGVSGAGFGVCVVDTGVDPNHEQMDNGKVVAFYDAINAQVVAYDDHGHGTHVASIIAGDGLGGGNADTYKGVAPGAEIYAAKVLNSAGSGTQSQVIAGIEWCAGLLDVDIISMSIGTTTPSDGNDAMSQAANSAVTIHNKIVVVAAGNSGPGPQSVGAPGAAAQAITVAAAANWSGDGYGVYLASFSSRGPTLDERIKPDIAAPGVRITAARAGTVDQYVTFSGTSMATPYTSGAIALALEADPSLTTASGVQLPADKVRALLNMTAQDRGPAGPDNEWGAGLLDAYALVAEALGAIGYQPTAFPDYQRVAGFVADGGDWLSQEIEITEDLVGIPIAATITIDGTRFCPFGIDLYCQLVGGWEWNPNLDAELLDVGTGLRVTANGGDITFSECLLSGEWCGVGRQETLHFVPTAPGTYQIAVYSLSGAGNFAVDLSTGPLGGTGGPPGNNPPVVADQGFAVDENAANGTLVGTAVAASDPDAGDSLSYAITAGNTAGAFAISTSTGQITVANEAALDFEATPSFALTVQVTDNGTPALSDTATVTVDLTDVNEAPTGITLSNDTVAENFAVGGTIGTLSAVDPDAGDTAAFSEIAD
ncbi:MAG: S8 family serine peptidase, partial [Kiloniellales bacterium]